MSKMKLAGKTPMCVECNKFYSSKKMDEVQTAHAHETGLCPACQANEVLMKKHTPVVEVVEVVEQSKSVITKAPSASKQFREVFASIVNNIDVLMETNLQDKDYTLATFGIRYPLLKTVIVSESAISLKEQLLVNGKARYSQKLVNVNGNVYAITNDIYDKNVEKMIEFAKVI